MSVFPQLVRCWRLSLSLASLPGLRAGQQRRSLWSEKAHIGGSDLLHYEDGIICFGVPSATAASCFGAGVTSLVVASGATNIAHFNCHNPMGGLTLARRWCALAGRSKPHLPLPSCRGQLNGTGLARTSGSSIQERCPVSDHPAPLAPSETHQISFTASVASFPTQQDGGQRCPLAVGRRQGRGSCDTGANNAQACRRTCTTAANRCGRRPDLRHDFVQPQKRCGGKSSGGNSQHRTP